MSRLNAQAAELDVVSAFRPVSQAAATVNGLTVEVKPTAGGQRYESAKLMLDAGLGGGTVDAVVQTSADGSTWVALNDEGGTQYALTQIAGASADSQLTVSLQNAERYIRCVITVASATSLISGTWALCGTRSTPIADG